MKIVIDIPEEFYEIIKTQETYIEEVGCILQDSAKNGTPLPKGHGDLIDRRDLKKEVYTTTEWNGDIHRIIYETSIDNAPTIIEGGEN